MNLKNLSKSLNIQPWILYIYKSLFDVIFKFITVSYASIYSVNAILHGFFLSFSKVLHVADFSTGISSDY